MATPKISNTLTPPEGTIVHTIDIQDQRWTIWEFSFRKVKSLFGSSLRGLVGQAHHDKKLILINTDEPLAVRRWTLDHELAHAVRWAEESYIPETVWDEFETDLMVLMKNGYSDFPPNTKEVFRALKAFLHSGSNPRRRARMLVNWLRERTDDPEKEGHPGAYKLPKGAAQRSEWWDGITI